MHILATVSFLASASSKAASKKSTSSGGGYEELIFIGLIVLAAWLLFFRPRSRQAQNQRQLLSTLVPGDEVLTGAGIYGTVLDVYPDRITIETAPGTRMTVSRSTVARKVEPTSAPDASGTAPAQMNGRGAYGSDPGGEYDEDDAGDEDDAEYDEYDDEQDEYDDEYDDEQGEGAAQDAPDGGSAAHGEAREEEPDDPEGGGADVSSGGGKGRRR